MNSPDIHESNFDAILKDCPPSGRFLLQSVRRQFKCDQNPEPGIMQESLVLRINDNNSLIAYAICVDKTWYVEKGCNDLYPKLFELLAIWVAEKNRGGGENALAYHLREKCLSWAQEHGATHVMFENTGETSTRKEQSARSLLKRGAELIEYNKPINRAILYILDLQAP